MRAGCSVPPHPRSHHARRPPPGGHAGRKLVVDVLDDDHCGGEVRRELTEDRGEHGRTACGSADRNQSIVLARRRDATARFTDAPAAGAESLPPIDSIDAGTDIRAFLAAGVPADVSRAALRRAWSSDPAIRDFIGLSENSWDFTAPDGVPGFGTLTADDVRRLLARLTDPEAQDPPPAPDTLPAQPAPEPAVEGRAAPELKALGDSPAPAQSANAAMQHESASNIAAPRESDQDEHRHPRSHGTALPE